MSMWLKNTAGKRDAVLTLAVIGFFIVALKILLSGASVEIAGSIYTFGTIDSGIVASMLTPTLGAYVARRYTDAKVKPDE